MRRVMLGAVWVGLLASCSKGDKGDKPGASDKGDPNEWKELTLADLGVKVTAPGDAKEAAMSGITARGGACDASIYAADPATTPFQNTVDNIERGNRGGPVKEMKRKDMKDERNWVIEFTTADLFQYESRRAIGTKTVACLAKSRTEAAHQCAVKVCESLAAI